MSNQLSIYIKKAIPIKSGLLFCFTARDKPLATLLFSFFRYMLEIGRNGIIFYQLCQISSIGHQTSYVLIGKKMLVTAGLDIAWPWTCIADPIGHGIRWNSAARMIKTE